MIITCILLLDLTPRPSSPPPPSLNSLASSLPSKLTLGIFDGFNGHLLDLLVGHLQEDLCQHLADAHNLRKFKKKWGVAIHCSSSNHIHEIHVHMKSLLGPHTQWGVSESV